MSTTYTAKKQPLLNTISTSINHPTDDEYASPVASCVSAPDCSPFNIRHRKHAHWQMAANSPNTNIRRKRRNRKLNQRSIRQRAQQQIQENTNGVWITTLIKEDAKKSKSVHAISVCERYNVDGISALFSSLNDRHEYSMFARYEDVLHFKPSPNSCDQKDGSNVNPSELRAGNLQSIVEDEDIFVFQNEGVIVFWNVSERTRSYFVSSLESFQINYPIDELSNQIVPQTDAFDYGLEGVFEIERGGRICLSLLDCFDANHMELCTECLTECRCDIKKDHGMQSMDRKSSNELNETNTVTAVQRRPSMETLVENLEQTEPDWTAVRRVLMCQKLAISFGLAQSLKVTVFEFRVDANTELNADIPKQMASKGSIGLNGKEIARRHGRLFLLRSELNLHSDVLDYPEHLYENDLFGKEYEQIRESLNVDERMEIINARFDLLHELFEIVTAQQESSHSACLEWIVIWLIVVEIVLGLTELLMPYISDYH